MKVRSRIFAALAEFYEESQAGRTGRGERDVQPTFEELCERVRRAQGSAFEGDAYELAVRELSELDGRVLRLQWDHPRARTTILKVRLSPRNEAEFYACLGVEAPTARRKNWSELFERFAGWPVPPQFAASWAAFCRDRAARSLHWDSMDPFRGKERSQGAFLLELTARLISWQGNNLIRWVSSHLSGDSKRLERRKRSLEPLLVEASGGNIPDFQAHGILPMPREAQVRGPLRLMLSGCWVDYGLSVQSPGISLADLQAAEAIECRAQRCLTIENRTPYHDISSRDRETLFIHTSFPTEATLLLLSRLAAARPDLEFWHFGDTDPQGFHILADLRRRSQLPFRSFHMAYRPATASILLEPFTPAEKQLIGKLLERDSMRAERADLEAMLAAGTKGDFEQESLQPPPLATWPYYPSLVE